MLQSFVQGGLFSALMGGLIAPMPAYAMDLAITQPNLSLLPIGGISLASGYEAVRNFLSSRAQDESDKSYY